jgi:alpha-ketoglutarate-dependent taurine dioxygenase
MSLDVEIIKPGIGAIVHADPQALVDGSVAKKVLELVEERGVIVFPRIGLTDAEQLKLTEHLGGRSTYSDFSHSSNVDTAGVYTVTLDPNDNPNPDYVHGTFFWHMDGVISKGIPPKATLLSARHVAAKGGQTEFANTYAAYAALPDALKAEINDLKVVHGIYAILKGLVKRPSAEDLARWAELPSTENVQQLVKTEPSGRKSMTLGNSADYIEGMPIVEGRALIARLQDWTVQPAFTYQHQWQEGDLVIWDNIGVLHRVVAYDAASGRRMNRTSVAHQPVSVAA